MAFTTYTGDTAIIAALATTAAERGLEPDEFKAKFDEAITAFVAWFNATHIVEADEHLVDIVTDSNGVHGLKIETGSWTPTLKGSATAGTNTYGTSVGRYYKIGQKVHARGRITLTAKDAAMAGNISIAGLPFASENITNIYAALNMGYYSNLTGMTGYGISGILSPNTTEISLFENGQNAIANIVAARIQNNTDLIFAIEYTAAS